MSTANRLAFEAWMKSKGWYAYCSNSPDCEWAFDEAYGNYPHAFARERWEVWQACTANMVADESVRDLAYLEWKADPKFYEWHTTEQCAKLHFDAGFAAGVAKLATNE